MEMQEIVTEEKATEEEKEPLKAKTDTKTEGTENASEI